MGRTHPGGPVGTSFPSFLSSGAALRRSQNKKERKDREPNSRNKSSADSNKTSRAEKGISVIRE